MRVSFVLGKRPHDRAMARACAGMNLALPGFGSILAGRVVGYTQAAITVIAFALTLVFGLKFIAWGLANWSTIHDPQGDPVETMMTLWRNARWPLLGIALFGVGWLWALATNLAILHDASKAEDSLKPPKLT